MVEDMLSAFRVLEREYRTQQKESGMVTPKPFIWVKNNETGELVVYSAFGEHSREIMEMLGIKE